MELNHNHQIINISCKTGATQFIFLQVASSTKPQKKKLFLSHSLICSASVLLIEETTSATPHSEGEEREIQPIVFELKKNKLKLLVKENTLYDHY